MTEDPVAVLREVFGFPAFRGLQETAVRHVIGGGDALVLMPTGGGKSVCYQVPALCREGTAVVISPLIALMDDQVAALRQLGVAAGALHSEIGEEEARRVGGLLERGTLDLLYMSPERLLSGGTLDRLARRRIALIAIDEAHCVSQWGHEFRPEYRALRRLPERFAGVPRVALTATADPRTRADILDALGMDHAAVFAASFHRANLHIAAEAKTGGPEQLAGVLRGRAEQTGIVYCGSRAKVDQVATSLSQRGLPALAFHAGLTPHHKRGALEKFRSGDAVVMVATIAFGMGIDRPDVRFVAHLDMPDSPEAYYQQIGRAGRDGLRADTLLLYGAQDIARARHWLSQSVAPEAEKQIRRQRLESMISLAETAACRTAALLACFGETLSGPCGHCDNCATPATLVDATVDAQKVISAIVRTGQRFGALHVVNVLTGKPTEMVTDRGHDRLPTFGVGSDRPATHWRGVIRQLLALGTLASSDDDRPTLRVVTDKAREILRGETTLMLRETADAPRTRTRERRSPTVAPPAPTGDRTDLGFAALRAWRAAEARTQRVPPYVIFHDTVLQDIALARPRTADELSQIKGVGASKLGRYGTAVLAVLREGA